MGEADVFAELKVGLGGLQEGAVGGKDALWEAGEGGKFVNQGPVDLVETFENVDRGRTRRRVREASVLEFERGGVPRVRGGAPRHSREVCCVRPAEDPGP